VSVGADVVGVAAACDELTVAYVQGGTLRDCIGSNEVVDESLLKGWVAGKGRVDTDCTDEGNVEDVVVGDGEDCKDCKDCKDCRDRTNFDDVLSAADEKDTDEQKHFADYVDIHEKAPQVVVDDVVVAGKNTAPVGCDHFLYFAEVAGTPVAGPAGHSEVLPDSDQIAAGTRTH
jgi:hypothetical protein